MGRTLDRSVRDSGSVLVLFALGSVPTDECDALTFGMDRDDKSRWVHEFVVPKG
jgi:hypothetical protein